MLTTHIYVGNVSTLLRIIIFNVPENVFGAKTCFGRYSCLQSLLNSYRLRKGHCIKGDFFKTLISFKNFKTNLRDQKRIGFVLN